MTQVTPAQFLKGILAAIDEGITVKISRGDDRSVALLREALETLEQCEAEPESEQETDKCQEN